MGQYFRHLATIPFNPRFDWVDSIEEVADRINLPHEDYPSRVTSTLDEINKFLNLKNANCFEVTTKNLLEIHNHIFADTDHAGKFRTVDVRVGLHVAPTWENVPTMITELHHLHSRLSDEMEISTDDILLDWYSDFENIHPFQDGNGRVGGVVVAVYSNLWSTEGKYLAPCQ